MRMLAMTLVLMAGTSAADPQRDLQAALPAGWKITTTKDTLIIERVLPVKITGRFTANEPHYGNAYLVSGISSPTEKLQLKYRTEPAWSAAKLEQTKAANKKIYAELEPLRAKYKIDDIDTAKGVPLPKTPDEERRLHDYQAAHEATLAKVTRVPLCTLGKLSVFDDRETYAQLSYMVDPQIAMREAYAVVELFKRRCKR